MYGPNIDRCDCSYTWDKNTGEATHNCSDVLIGRMREIYELIEWHINPEGREILTASDTVADISEIIDDVVGMIDAKAL